MWQDRVHDSAAAVSDAATGPMPDAATGAMSEAGAGGVSRRPSRPLRAEAGGRWTAGGRQWERPRVLHVDCDTCTARGLACDDCVIGVLLGPPGRVELDDDEQAALSALAESGMVPPLRLVSSEPEHRTAPAPAEPDPAADGWGDADDGWGTPAGDWI